MLKKILIIICLIVFSFGSLYANRNNGVNNNNGPSTSGNGITNSTTPNGSASTGRNNTGNGNSTPSSTSGNGSTPLNSASSAASSQKAAARTAFCNQNPSECIEQPTFSVITGNIFGSNQFDQAGTTKELVNNTLGTIIQKLMIAMGSIALLIMTIGGGYMIFHAGKDDILSKGKSIFTGGLIALVVALSSYYIISIVRFILYDGN